MCLLMGASNGRITLLPAEVLWNAAFDVGPIRQAKRVLQRNPLLGLRLSPTSSGGANSWT